MKLTLVDKKRIKDIMKWTGETTYEEVVANSVHSRWQHLREVQDEIDVINKRDAALNTVKKVRS